VTRREITEPEVIGNAQILLGYVTGSLRLGGDGSYDVVEVDADGGNITLQNTTTGSTFMLTVVQIGGVE
jgi:hypothetical protein